MDKLLAKDLEHLDSLLEKTREEARRLLDKIDDTPPAVLPSDNESQLSVPISYTRNVETSRRCRRV